MQLELERELSHNLTTRGSLFLNGEFECFTLEDEDRHLETGGVKVPKETAIPRGMYKVTIDWSNRFKRRMPHVLDVPQFEGIRIHAGNTKEDTEGCILVGQQRSGDMVIESRLAFDTLFEKMEQVIGYGEEITLEVQ